MQNLCRLSDSFTSSPCAARNFRQKELISLNLLSSRCRSIAFLRFLERNDFSERETRLRADFVFRLILSGSGALKKICADCRAFAPRFGFGGRRDAIRLQQVTGFRPSISLPAVGVCSLSV